MAAAAPLPGRDLRRARDRLGQADRRHRSGKSGHDKLALLGRTGALKAAWSRGRQHEPGSAIASGAEPGCVAIGAMPWRSSGNMGSMKAGPLRAQRSSPGCASFVAAAAIATHDAERAAHTRRPTRRKRSASRKRSKRGEKRISPAVCAIPGLIVASRTRPADRAGPSCGPRSDLADGRTTKVRAARAATPPMHADRHILPRDLHFPLGDSSSLA